ncbi:MAG TPA: hypothetical protein VEY71_12285 [Chitinophagales bacterium]|nr:hypothetical protein [Chitinophagales bacterium]
MAQTVLTERMLFSKKTLRLLYTASLVVWLGVAALGVYRFFYKRHIFNSTPSLNGLVVELDCKRHGTSTAVLEHNGVRYTAFFQNKRCRTVSVGDVASFHELPNRGFALLSDEEVEKELYYAAAFFLLAGGSLFFLMRTFKP